MGKDQILEWMIERANGTNWERTALGFCMTDIDEHGFEGWLDLPHDYVVESFLDTTYEVSNALMSDLRTESNDLSRSRLTRSHAVTGRFLRTSLHRRRVRRENILFGERGLKWPLMALRTQMDLGPARHALAQMVVAGEMVVFPPFVPNFPTPQAPKKAQD